MLIVKQILENWFGETNQPARISKSDFWEKYLDLETAEDDRVLVGICMSKAFGRYEHAIPGLPVAYRNISGL